MKRNRWVRMLSLFLAFAMLVLSGCGAGSNGEETAAAAAEDQVDSGLRFQPEWTRDAMIYEVNIRQYTPEGTFAAFGAHLQEIRDMGFNVLWIMPVHPISQTNRIGELGSYYSITDYCAVNPEFGTAEDFKALVDQAHELGFHVMMDWVANHTGWDCPWITEHPDWYTQDADGTILSPANMGWDDVADLNYDNEQMQQEMIRCMKYWVENFDVDGFRCDYANGVPVSFWEKARAELETVKPMYMLAEDNTVKQLLDYAFDMNYNWGLYDALIQMANGAKKASLVKLYIPSDYPQGTYALNFVDNHDKNTYEGTILEHFGAEKLPLVYAFLYTIPGAPLIYTGDEIGLDHALEFFSRDPVDWDCSERSYREELTALAAIRSENPALYCGNYGGAITYIDVGSDRVLAFSREKDGNEIKAIFNMAKREHEVDLTQWLSGDETVLLHGIGEELLDMQAHPIGEDGLSQTVTLAPWEFYIVREG